MPFLDAYLKASSSSAKLAAPLKPVTAFETGSGEWKSYDAWPRSCADGCPTKG